GGVRACRRAKKYARKRTTTGKSGRSRKVRFKVMKSVLSKFGLVVGAFCALGAMGCDGGSEDDGGGSGTGGTSGGTGGATGEPGVELLTDDAKTDGWIGGDETTAEDDPKGIQGAIYMYGDDISCTVVEGNPCTAEGCCISGSTIVDDTFAAWGC